MRRLVTANWKIITVIAGLIPLVVLVMLIARYSVNVPFEDEWSETAALKGFSQVPTLSFLFSQHNEHRVFVPRLLLWVSTSIGNGDLRCTMAMTLGLAIIASLLAMRLLRRTLPDDQPWQGWWLAVNLLILSPMQHHNWLWAFQVAFYLPIVCLLAGLVVIDSLADSWPRTWLCMFLALLSGLSMTNGLLVAVLLPLVMLAQRPALGRARLLAWGLFATGLWIGYFYHWHRIVGHTEPHWCLHHPLAAARYLLVFLGSCVNYGHGILLPKVIGAAALAVWLAQLGYVAKHRRDGNLLPKVSPWLAVGAFAVISALMATWGRAGFGLQQAGESRYTTTALQLMVAVLALWPILSANLPGRRPAPAVVAWSAVGAASLLMCFIVSQVRCVQEIHQEWAQRLRGQAGLELTHYPNSDVLLGTLFPVPQCIYPIAADMSDRGRLHPAILPANSFAAIASGTPAKGWFQDSRACLDGSIRVRGTAWLPDGRAADCVLITFTSAAQPAAVIWMLRVPITKPERSLIAGEEELPGLWQDLIPAEQAPPLNGTLNAWAFDATTRTAYRLEQSHPWHQEYLRIRYLHLLQP